MTQKTLWLYSHSHKQRLSGKKDVHLHQVVPWMSKADKYSFPEVIRHLPSTSAAGVMPKEAKWRVGTLNTT